MGRYYYGDIEGKFWFGVQSSDAADRFGSIGCEPNYINYYYSKENLPDVQEEIKNIEETNKEGFIKLEAFFKDKEYYNNDDLELAMDMPKEAVRKIVSDYADYKLGQKI